MRRFFFFSLILGLGFWLPLPGRSQTAAGSKPVSAAASPAATGTDSTEQKADETEAKLEDLSGEKPFTPHWTGQLGFTYSTQPNSQGQGQVTKELGLTGTYNMTESGNYFSLAVAGGQQLLEGANTNYGELTVEGGLGLGLFLPSLSFAIQEGASALDSYTTSLNLNFQVMDSLTVGPTGSLGLESHQGPMAQIIPTNTTNPNTILAVDTGDWAGGIMASFVPVDYLTFSLTAQQETDYTFDTHGINGNNFKTINQSDVIPSVTLEGELTFLANFQLELSAQAGEEDYSAGTVFSPVTGKTRTFAKPTSEGFSAFVVGLLYNFQ